MRRERTGEKENETRETTGPVERGPDGEMTHTEEDDETGALRGGGHVWPFYSATTASLMVRLMMPQTAVGSGWQPPIGP